MSLFRRRQFESLAASTRQRSARSQDYRSRKRRHLRLESLESRQLLTVFGGDPDTAISGKVLDDPNANGVSDPGEDGLPDWTVYLDLNTNGLLDLDGEGNPEPSLLTNVDGEYIFSGLLAGNYRIAEVVQEGWTPTSPWFRDVVVQDTKEEHVSFHNVLGGGGPIPGIVSGTIWNDHNGDGIRTPNPGEDGFLDEGLVNWNVFLDVDHNGSADPGEPATTTDTNGYYTFNNVTAGDYWVTEELPIGCETSPGFSASVLVGVVSAQESIVDFANIAQNSVSGTVWNDADGNGSFGGGEAGLSGWTVYVDLDASGGPSAGEPTAVTDANGDYTLVAIPLGTRTVAEVLNVGWRFTSPTTGSYLLNLTSGQHLTNINFGNQQRTDAAISGAVYVDSNHDGLRNPGERGLAGITVYLDGNNNGALDPGEPSQVTLADLFYTPTVDETGGYSFTHLAQGTYHVRQIVPADQQPTPESQRHKIVDLLPGEDRQGVNLGNIYRPNEVHGTKFDDSDGDHHRDPDEPGIEGVTIYIDTDRDNMHDAGEPSTVSGPDGSYSFTNLEPGAYVVREGGQEGYVQTYPSSVGGTLWPEGLSHPAVGNVTPTSITTSLTDGQSYHQNVSITLPNSGSLTNLVDVFLLFDDTGSFTANSPIVRAAFPEIIASLQAALPGIDLGFGVGRLEEYGNFAAEFPEGRPFVLNQPIVASSTPGYTAAIQAALDRMAPGYGGDQPETVFEALYQVVSGAGFDGNNNGSLLDSGAAGLISTQINPGASGDVPSFASFALDPSGAVLPAAGNVGGAGFRPGALPVILTATDTGFAYQPKGETTVTGLGGLTLPIAALTQTSRPTTPFGAGAGIQQTITGLNALGALVIGLGTNAEAGIDPRQGLEAIAKLTGATNQTAGTIANGTADPIAPGDPFYFQITSGFGPSVAAGVVAAIQNAVTSVAVNLTLRASDPSVHIVNHTGVIPNVGAGSTATFDVEFVGDGRPHRFDLQFVREGTNVVLGSIPVVLGTPVAGDGYEWEDLDEGEIEDAEDFGNHLGLVGIVSSAPSFVQGSAQTVVEDAGPQTVANWATNISPGSPAEAGQALDFIVTADNAGLFSVQPAIVADGTLSYTPAPNANGTATVTVFLHDDGGTAAGGIDTSVPRTLIIKVTPVNDPPVAAADAYTVERDTALSVPIAGGVLANDTDPDSPTFTAVLDTDVTHGTLAMQPDGSFAYSPAVDFVGSDQFSYHATDGADSSAVVTATISVTPGSLVVTNTLDAGPGSLRSAILAANSTPGTPDTIIFEISGAGPQAIGLASPLPDLVDPATAQVAAGEVQVGTFSAFPFARFTSLTKTGAGTLVLSGNQSHQPGAQLVAQEGTLRLASDAGPNLTVTVDEKLDIAAGQHLAGLAIGAGGVVDVLAGGASLVVTPSLSIAAGGRLDLADNDFVVLASAATRDAALANITAWLASGINAFAWNGPGIASSVAAANPTHLTAVGVMLNDDGLGGAYRAAFDGEPVNANSILVKYTYYGDADLSGTIDGTDYALTDNGFNSGLSSWFNGDADYTGHVDGTDYALLDNAFNNSRSGPLSPARLDQSREPPWRRGPTEEPRPARRPERRTVNRRTPGCSMRLPWTT